MQLVLTLSDLPPGFSQTLGRVLTNSAADGIGHVAPGSNARNGRITGYQASFHQTAQSGLTNVDEALALFGTTVAAHRKLVNAVRRTEQGGLPPGYQHLSLGRLGSEAVAFTYTLNRQATGVSVYVRRGRYTTELIGGGSGRGFRPAQVVSLARIGDQRITHAGA